jgi:hypothetical protein
MKKLKDLNPDWYYRFVIIAITVATLLMACGSCNQKRIDYRWRIRGHVRMSTDSNDTTTHPAIWMTDTFRIVRDTLIITNSDSSQWRVAPPYQIDRLK